MGCPRVLLADGHEKMLDVISHLLEEDFDVVATVRDGESVIDAVARLDPDLVVLDIFLPILNGFQIAARLKESNSRTKVVMLTIDDDPYYVEAAFSAGVLGYVLKSRIAIDLIPANREVLQGRTFVSPSLGKAQEGQ